MIAPAEPAADPHEPDPPPALGPVRLTLLLLWAAASFGTCYFARDLQVLLGRPLQAYGLAAQGILIVFIVLVLFNAWYFNRQQPEHRSGPLPEADHGA